MNVRRKSSERTKTLHKVDCFPHQGGRRIKVLRHKNPTTVKLELNDSVGTSKGGVRITPTYLYSKLAFKVDDYA